MKFYPNNFDWDRRWFKAKQDLRKTIYKAQHGQPKIIFDVGANNGIYSMRLSKKYKTAKVYAFEPVKSTFDNLVKNIKINNFKNICPYNFGFYKKKQVMELGIPESDRKDPTRNEVYRLHSLGNERLIKKVKARFEISDDFIRQEGIEEIDILKIDVEGSERHIFENGEYMLKITRILHLELWDQNLDMIDFLKNYNFKWVSHWRQNNLFIKN